jgi:hypothetical protein
MVMMEQGLEHVGPQITQIKGIRTDKNAAGTEHIEHGFRTNRSEE